MYRRSRVILWSFVGGLGALATIIFITNSLGSRWKRVEKTAETSEASGTTRPATTPTTVTSQATTEHRDYAAMVAVFNPALTAPAPAPVDLTEAASVRLHSHIYICSRRDLWISHPLAPPTRQVLAVSGKSQAHLVRERVLFVRWIPNHREGWIAQLVVSREDGSCAWLTHKGETPIHLEHRALWDKAMFWNNAIILPTDRGVYALLSPDDDPNSLDFRQVYIELAEEDVQTDIRVRLMPDWSGLLAWAPPNRDGVPQGKGIVRFQDAQWQHLDPAEWPPATRHLVPLRDGSVLKVEATGPTTSRLTLSPLDQPEIDRQLIERLVEQLGDPDASLRDEAMSQLSQYGPGLWPILEALQPDQVPEANARIQRLLGHRVRPSLLGVTPVDDKFTLISWLSAGGAVFYCDGGVELPRPGQSPTVIPRAWVTVRPGESGQLLPEAMTRDLVPDRHHVDSLFGGGSFEWVVYDPDLGPRRFIGNRLVPLLQPGDRGKYNRVLGIDRQGRWVFKSTEEPDRALILDPAYADPTPRLPVWELATDKGVGWTDEGWPAVRMPQAAALKENGWQGIEEEKSPIQTTQSNVEASTQPAHRLLLTDGEGRHYFNGTDHLLMKGPDGRVVDSPLPPEAIGSTNPSLVRTKSGKLLLYNTPGRILRLREAANGFEVEATFTRGVPSTDDISRIWLDPADRLCIVHGGNTRLSIFFPEGYIPRPIARMMPAGDDAE